MDAIVKPWPKGSNPPLSDHVRNAPQPVNPRPSREEAEAAAVRELFEETGVRADLVDILARSKEEHFYDLPDDMIGRIWKGKYRGQRQIWFLMRFKGSDADINIETEHQEFTSWQWVDADMVPQLIVPFKKRLYENIVAEFADLI